MTVTGAIIPNGPYIADPYAYERTIPAVSAWGAFQPKSANNWSGNISNPTGVLAFNAAPASQGGGGDVTINKSVTLASGIYIISGGSLRMTANNPNVSLNGTGVTIILTSPTPSTDTGVFNFSGGTLNLTAPTTGSTAGIALWADSRLPYVTDSFSSNVAVNIDGAIYLPSHNVQYQGNNVSQNTGCKQLIAWTIVITGTSNFNHNCPPGSGTLDPAITWSLVE